VEQADKASRELDAARVEAARESTSARLLARFIEDRASSADYRKHLGVLALVRDDFERLSGLIEAENWRLSPDGLDDQRFSGTLQKFATLTAEKAEAAMRINRIVLYIDDLDRCPPKKVVDVLQAVHLLLAFPPFVVVVGVDARWVKRSLETRYGELLHRGSTGDGDDLSHMFGMAGSGDYLEKIFQVPLWLRPMGSGSARRMVQGLVRRPSTRANVQAAREVLPQSDVSKASSSAAPDVPRAGREANELSQGSTDDRTEAPTTIEHDTLGNRGSDAHAVPNVEALDINELEIKFIDVVSSLLGRSPRALKRFVNVYRLIKAGLTSSEHAVFIRPREGELSDYEAVLFLLAVDTGLPLAARMFFALLRSPDVASEPSVQRLIAGLEIADDAPARTDVARLRTWLTEHANYRALANGVNVLIRWTPVVARYSFEPSDR
jgi:hypothetical protein